MRNLLSYSFFCSRFRFLLPLKARAIPSPWTMQLRSTARRPWRFRLTARTFSTGYASAAARAPTTRNGIWSRPPAAISRPLTIPEKFQPSGFTRDGAALYGMYEVNKMAQLATLTLPPANTPAAAAATPVPLTALPRGVHSALISPDGSHFALSADPRLPDPLSEVHTVIEAQPTSLYVIAADGSGGVWWCPALRDVDQTCMVARRQFNRGSVADTQDRLSLCPLLH